MLEDMMTAQFWLALVQIIWINILLSGDNAVVIALASRSLPEQQRRWAILGGSAGAIILRILFCLIVAWLLAIPYLKLIGGLLLLWIGVKLIVPEDEHGEDKIAAKSNLIGAIQTIVIADAVMSLDNVIGIVAAAGGSTPLIVFGLVISVPLIIFGSQLVLTVLLRFPILVILGGGLLGWIAGEIMATDPAVIEHSPIDAELLHTVAKPVFAALVVAVGWLLARRAKARAAAIVDLAEGKSK
jgi:YjbE family integral membrane protein